MNISWRRRLLWCLLAFVVLGGVLTYPAYRQVRVWRAHSFAAEAEILLKEPETLVRAWELARAANALHPDGLQIARALARVHDAGDPHSAPAFWERVVERSERDPDDRLALTEAYLAAGNWERFQEELLLLEKLPHKPLHLQYLRILAAGRQGELDEAFQLAEVLVKEANAPEEADFLYVQLTQFSSDPSIRRDGIEHLWEISARGGQRGLAALRNLTRAPALAEEELRRLVSALQELPSAEREDRLLGEEISLRLPDTQPDSVYERVKSLFRLDDPNERAALGRWLNRQGLHTHTLQAVPLEEALSRQDLFLVRADALALLDRWREIGNLLDRPRVPLEEYLRSFFRMRVFLETGDLRRADLAWNSAILAAGRDSVKVYYLAEKAQTLGLTDFQTAALRRVAETAPLRRRALEDLVRVFQSQGETAKLRQTMEQLLDFFPDDREILNDTLYLGFLTNKAKAGDLQRARALLTENPEMLAYRMTVVLGLLRKGHTVEGLDLLLDLPVNWFEVRDRWRLLFAVILFREGYSQKAQDLTANVNKASLLPEESLFFNEVRTGE